MGPHSAKVNGATQRIPSAGGNLYTLNVVCSCTRYKWTATLQRKSDAAEAVIHILRKLKTQFPHYPIAVFHSDAGKEFINAQLGEYLDANGIQQTYTTRNHPQHNGKCERANQTSIVMTRSMLEESKAPVQLWGDAIVYATMVYNFTPLRVIGAVSPYQKLTGQQPDLSKVRVFGCDAFYALPDTERSKFQPTFTRGVWIGYSMKQNASRILTADGRIVVTRDVKLDEDSFQHMTQLTGVRSSEIDMDDSDAHVSQPTLSEPDASSVPKSCDPIEPPLSAINPSVHHHHSEPASSGDAIELDNHASNSDQEPEDIDESSSAADSDTDTQPFTDMPLHTTRAGRVSKPVFRYGIGNIADYGDKSDRESIMALLSTYTEPTSYQRALTDQYADEWHLAMNKEIASMAHLEVYELVPRSKDMNVIRSRWVYKLKRDANHLPTVWKARLVAKGFQQIYGVDYLETYAPVVRYKSIRMILALAAQYGLEIYQLDYHTAFLNATLPESIYMAQPEGFEVGMNLVWKLRKAIYGLKQSPYEWNTEVDTTMRKCGYEPICSDSCVYIKRVDGYPPIILALYVDDTIAAVHPDSLPTWEQDKQIIAATYKITDLGACKWILNMELQSARNAADGLTYTLSQRPYVEQMLNKFDMVECKPVQSLTLISSLTDPFQDKGEPLTIPQHEIYRSIVGAMLYLANTTRMDISFAVGVLSRFVAAPYAIHLTAAKHILRYLKGSAGYKMMFRPMEMQQPRIDLVAYSDADWAGDKFDRKSTTGMIVQLFGNTITWTSRKQTTVALSSTESEYMALAATCQELLWCSTWLQEVLGTEIPLHMQVYGDNQSALALVQSNTHHDRSKHIDIRYHFIKQLVKQGIIKLDWVKTDQQKADIMTKALPRPAMHKFRDQLLQA